MEMNKKVLLKLTYGMYVVTSKMDGKINGQVANTVFQVSSDPPLIAISINKENLTHKFIEKNKRFGVSILSKEAPLSLIGRFGFKTGREIDKFDGVEYITGETGVPLLKEHVVGFLEVELVNSMDVGTHTIFIGKVLYGDIVDDKTVMTYAYYHEVKRGTSPVRAPTYIKEEIPKEEAKAKRGVDEMKTLSI